jgi:hypothetical protein
MSRLSVPVCIGILLFAGTTLAPTPLCVSKLEADNSVTAQLAYFQIAEGYEVNLFAYELRDFIKYLSTLKNADSPK